MLVAGCSTRKNTAGTRFYHALTTRYNVYFNGNEAYKAGLQAQQQGNKDNYMEMLPLYPIGNKETTGIGTSDYERAIEKAQKLFVNILSSDAPYVNQDGHTRTNTKNGCHVGSSILSYTVHGCYWEKHNIRKEISRKLPQPFLISCASMTDRRISLPKL